MAFLLWITGLSGSGKTTIAKAVLERLQTKYNNIALLDGDVIREILAVDLGYSDHDRRVGSKRIHKMCNFLVSQNINVICSTMSLYKEVHELNRKKIKNYYEVFIDCDMEELIRRDKKGLYSDALKGKRNDVVGVNIPFDHPSSCDVWIDNSKKNNLEGKVDEILKIINIDLV